jgi:hypothetical protein
MRPHAEESRQLIRCPLNPLILPVPRGRRLTAALLLLLANAVPSLAQPGWYTQPEAQHPRTEYRIGLGVSSDPDRATRLNLARESARGDLVMALRTHITAAFSGVTTELSGQIDQQLRSQVSSTSSLEVDGIEVAQQTDDRGTACALAVLATGSGRRLHAAKAEQLDAELAAGMPQAAALAQAGETAAALRHYGRLQTLAALGATPRPSCWPWGTSPAPPSPDWTRRGANPPVGRAQIQAAIDRLTQAGFRTVDDAAAAPAFRLAAQLPSGQRALVLPFTYGETRFGSAWSRYLARTVAARLLEQGLQPAEPPERFIPRGANHEQELASQACADVIVRGPYRIFGANIKVSAFAVDPRTPRKVAVAEVTLDTTVAQQAGLDYRPQNWQQAQQDHGVLGQGEVISGALRAEVWTDRGAEALALDEGEHVNLVVRANQPAYLQIVYHLADGKRALLYHNYCLDAAKVNCAVELPDTFVVAAPFGVEVLQVSASTRRFPEVSVRDWQGYQVLAEDLAAYVGRVRGLRRLEPGRQTAEARLTLTTLPRAANQPVGAAGR